METKTDDTYAEFNTRMVSARIEESIYKKMKIMNLSARECIWKGIQAAETQERVIRDLQTKLDAQDAKIDEHLAKCFSNIRYMEGEIKLVRDLLEIFIKK